MCEREEGCFPFPSDLGLCFVLSVNVYGNEEVLRDLSQ